MPAITQVIFVDTGVEIHRGVLIDVPVELISKEQIASYKRAKLGWSKCPLGYNVYAQKDSLGQKIVIPGIVLEDDVGKRRKFPGYSHRFTKEKIELYLKPHLERSEDIRSQRDTLFRRLTHDLRAISTEIYHEALAVRDTLRSQRHYKLADAVDVVLASQQMMSVRLDIVDYESGQASLGAPGEIEVFKKVQKVFLAFQRKMRSKGISSSLEGSSFSVTFGSNTLEILIFILIENAVKYSPTGKTIIVEVFENDASIVVSVRSFGPCIATNEREKIFESGSRGVAAKRFKLDSGSGIGLFAAKTIAKQHFRGDCQVVQEPDPIKIDGFNFYETTFFLTLPITRKIDVLSGRETSRFRPQRKRVRRRPYNPDRIAR